MYPRSGGMGENTPFAEQSKEKEQDKGHNSMPASSYAVDSGSFQHSSINFQINLIQI